MHFHTRHLIPQGYTRRDTNRTHLVEANRKVYPILSYIKLGFSQLKVLSADAACYVLRNLSEAACMHTQKLARKATRSERYKLLVRTRYERVELFVGPGTAGGPLAVSALCHGPDRGRNQHR